MATLTRPSLSLERPKSLATQLAKDLTDRIARGDLKPGDKLPSEHEMVASYGVSRTVVREVLSRLKSAGLVETRQGSGTVVLDPASSDSFRLGRPDEDPARGVLRIIELRRGLEGEMAALAAERRSVQDMRRINRALAEIDYAVQMDGDGVEEDLAFHIAIAQATGNPHYPELLGMLTRALKDAIRVTRGNEARQARLAEEVRNEHEAIRAAIESQDIEAARAAAFHHMLSTAKRIQNVDAEYWQGASSAAAGRLARTRLAAELRKAK